MQKYLRPFFFTILLIALFLSRNEVKVASYVQYSLYTGNVGLGATVYDPIPPTVTITNPQNGSIISRVVSYSATATDNVGVTYVEFYVDNNLLGTNTSAPYSISWDTTHSSDGLHYLIAKAFDGAGNVGTSGSAASFTVRVDNLAPVVNVTNPTNGSSVSGIVNVTADAFDSSGISNVEFYVDNSLLGTDNSAPYAASWDTSSYPSNSSHTIFVKAFDVAGNIGTSQSITVSKADTVAPQTSVTSPTNGSSISGTVNITANASDDVGINRVEFYVDGGLLGTDTSAPYSSSWDTTIYANNSSHTIFTKAYDGAGNIGTSQTVSVTVLDVTAPTVAITNPLNGAIVTRGTTVTITANASDASGVSKVEFRVNGNLKCSDTVAPYSCNWHVPLIKNKTYNLEAKAFDTLNHTATNTITVTSSN